MYKTSQRNCFANKLINLTHNVSMTSEDIRPMPHKINISRSQNITLLRVFVCVYGEAGTRPKDSAFSVALRPQKLSGLLGTGKDSARKNYAFCREYNKTKQTRTSNKIGQLRQGSKVLLSFLPGKVAFVQDIPYVRNHFQKEEEEEEEEGEGGGVDDEEAGKEKEECLDSGGEEKFGI